MQNEWWGEPAKLSIALVLFSRSIARASMCCWITSRTVRWVLSVLVSVLLSLSELLIRQYSTVYLSDPCIVVSHVLWFMKPKWRQYRFPWQRIRSLRKVVYLKSLYTCLILTLLSHTSYDLCNADLVTCSNMTWSIVEIQWETIFVNLLGEVVSRSHESCGSTECRVTHCILE